MKAGTAVFFMNTFAFVDASNLFYGGAKSLGWKIDYQKLIAYLRQKYQASRVLYFGGVELHGFPYDYLTHDTVPLEQLAEYLTQYIREQGNKLDEAHLVLLSRHVQRVKFYHRLKSFGYETYLKPVKLHEQDDGTTKRKAHCDVEMAFYLMKERSGFDRAVILSGDGDFLPVLKYLKLQGKEIYILARGHRTAREVRRFAGGNFRDFVRLEKHLKFQEHKKDGHAKYPPYV